MKKRVLFILKLRHSYQGETAIHLSSGLFNSARFVNDMLVRNGIESKLVQVVDNNRIDREVSQYKPTHVIIEAFWVVPEKFDILTKLHPDVTWIIRNHSEIPFLANEGNVMNWIVEYLKRPNVVVSRNSERTNEEIRFLAQDTLGMRCAEVDQRVVYLPNYYPVTKKPRKHRETKHIDIGCFGAIRPLKNHLMQAMAAIKFARLLGKPLHFHINVGRVEGRGEPILKNLRALFAATPDSKLVEHDWLDHEEFLKLVRHMDMGLQVSFSESFNITAADFVSQGVPVVVSSEIQWASSWFKAEPTRFWGILGRMSLAWFVQNWIPCWNPSLHGLLEYNRKSRHVWTRYFR